MTDSLFETAPCAIFCFSDDGRLVMANQTLCNLLQLSKEEISGKHIEAIFTIPTRIFFQTHFYPLVKMHGHAEEIFITLLEKNGNHLPVLLNANRMKVNGSEITCCACIVVHNRKKFEDEIVNARKTAEKALLENTDLLNAKAELVAQTDQLEEQMEKVRKQNHELQQFSHAVTHNLKEPLRKILLYSGKLQMDSPSRDLERLLRSSEQMKNVVTGLQEYIWLNEKPNQFKDVDLNVVISKSAKRIMEEYQSDVLALTAGHMEHLEGDEAQLELLFYHLLANAVKFRKGDKAVVHIQATPLKQNKFRSLKNRYQYEDFLRLEIRDEGMGFNPSFKDIIFELFRRLHNEEGQGLGLALCRKIVENHGGVISADSEVNRYAEIKIWLPVKQSNAQRPTSS